MKKFTQLIILSGMVLMCSCSEYVLVPQYVSVEKLNALEAGMSKEAVSAALSVAPYDAYHSTENGCELYSFKYLHRYQEINPRNKTQRGALRNNVTVYDDENDAFLYFENGLLRNLIIAGAKVDHDFVSDLITACNGPVSGCTDSNALNFNDNAIIDDSSCEYCPCDYVKNPNYNINNECEEECIPVGTDETDNTEDCSLCDVINGSNENVTINISTSAPWGNSSGNQSGNTSGNIAISSHNNSPANTKGGGSKKLDKLNKNLEKLQAELEASKTRDSKKGKKSKRTELLELSIEKIESAISQL